MTSIKPIARPNAIKMSWFIVFSFREDDFHVVPDCFMILDAVERVLPVRNRSSEQKTTVQRREDAEKIQVLAGPPSGCPYARVSLHRARYGIRTHGFHWCAIY